MQIFLGSITIIFFISLFGWMKFYKNVGKKEETNSRFGLTIFVIIFIAVVAGGIFLGDSFSKETNILDKYGSVEAFKQDCAKYTVEDVYNLDKKIKNKNVMIDGIIEEYSDKYIKLKSRDSTLEDEEFYLLVAYNQQMNNIDMQIGDEIRVWGVCTGVYIKKYNNANISALSLEKIN